MRSLTDAYVAVLLFKSFVKNLVWQLYVKLTKFTRRSTGPKSFLRKFAAACQFLKGMSEYNWEVLKRCRSCMEELSSRNVPLVLVYGDKDVTEVLHALSLATHVKMRILREDYEAQETFKWEEVPVEIGIFGNEKIIVASLINIQERIRRLRELGVDCDRLVLLVNGSQSRA